MAKRKRDIQLKVRVTPEERAMIEAKMAQLGTTNMAAFMRKMAIDGYVLSLIHICHRKGARQGNGRAAGLCSPAHRPSDVGIR